MVVGFPLASRATLRPGSTPRADHLPVWAPCTIRTPTPRSFNAFASTPLPRPFHHRAALTTRTKRTSSSFTRSAISHASTQSISNPHRTKDALQQQPHPTARGHLWLRLPASYVVSSLQQSFWLIAASSRARQKDYQRRRRHQRLLRQRRLCHCRRDRGIRLLPDRASTQDGQGGEEA